MKNNSAQCDFVVHGNCAVSPSQKVVQIRPMNGSDERLLSELRKAEHARDIASQELQQCLKEANEELLVEEISTKHPEKAGMLLSKYKAKGRKERQEKLYPQLWKEIEEARKDIHEKARYPDQSSETYKDACEKAVTAKGSLGKHLTTRQRKTFLQKVIRAFSTVFWLQG